MRPRELRDKLEEEELVVDQTAKDQGSLVVGPGADGVEGPLEGEVALVEDLEGGVMSEAGDRVGFVESHPDDVLFAGVGVFGPSQFGDELVERGEGEG